MISTILPIVGVILPVIGIVLGAFFQFYFSKYLEQQRHRREIRTKAYTDYLNCVSELANQRPDQKSPEGKALSTRTADAKCRICLYGSSQAIDAFAKFENLGATMNTEEQCDSFVSMVMIMRNDSIKGANVIKNNLRIVILGRQKDWEE